MPLAFLQAMVDREDGSGERVLWEHKWDSLDLDYLPESEQKVEKKVYDYCDPNN